jgi:hypothetical protein
LIDLDKRPKSTLNNSNDNDNNKNEEIKIVLKDINKNINNQNTDNSLSENNYKTPNDYVFRSQSYGEIIPAKSDLNWDAPLLPYPYQNPFKIKKIISNLLNSSITDNICQTLYLTGMEESSSYMRIHPPSHVILYIKIKINLKILYINLYIY